MNRHCRADQLPRCMFLVPFATNANANDVIWYLHRITIAAKKLQIDNNAVVCLIIRFDNCKCNMHISFLFLFFNFTLFRNWVSLNVQPIFISSNSKLSVLSYFVCYPNESCPIFPDTNDSLYELDSWYNSKTATTALELPFTSQRSVFGLLRVILFSSFAVPIRMQHSCTPTFLQM